MYRTTHYTLGPEVERMFGRKILSSSDCHLLSQAIFEATHMKVSVNTLRRLFNLMATKYKPSLFTLDVVAKYCGFNSYSDFTSRNLSNPSDEPVTDTALLDFLVLLFKDSDAKAINDATYIGLVEATIRHLNHWPAIIDHFQCRISKTVNGQKFYFEQFVNIDKLNSYFGSGLRYYLHEKRKPEAQIFGHSLLCFNSWLTTNPEALEQNYRDVMHYNIDGTMDMFVCGRYFAAQLYYLDMTGNPPESVIYTAREFYQSVNLTNSPAKNFPAFEYVMAECLVLTHQYDEALLYIQDAIRKRNSYVPSHITSKLFESIYLFHASALCGMGKFEKSRDIFDSINTNNFHFLTKQYNTILYITLKRKLDRRNTEDKQLEYLCDQTGFRQLFPSIAKLNEVSVHQSYSWAKLGS
ncbi:MAG: hypothetical protein ABWZ25_12180 [Chitinophagaceae bacterium]